MRPKKVAPRKPAATRRSGGSRRGLGRILLAVALLLAVGVFYLVARNYMIETSREEVEAIVGELDPAGVTMRVADAQAAQQLVEKLRAAGGGLLSYFSVDSVTATKNSIRIKATFDGKKYEIELIWEAPKPPPKPRTQLPAKPKPALPRLALVIDDMGTSVATAREFMDLPYPVTPAVIPFLSHSTDVAHLYSERNHPFFLHMPMEPQGYPSQKPGKGAIMTGDGPDKVKKLLASALDSVPGASGVNNHMGSRATESKALMAPVMEELDKRGLAFLDSETSPKSIAAETAKAKGVSFGSRDVFLDNEARSGAIEAQLKLAVERAKKQGYAVAIGHDRPETLKVLKAWGGKFEAMGVEIVPVTEVLSSNRR